MTRHSVVIVCLFSQIHDRERLEKEKSTLDNKIADLQVELSALKNGKHEPGNQNNSFVLFCSLLCSKNMFL